MFNKFYGNCYTKLTIAARAQSLIAKKKTITKFTCIHNTNIKKPYKMTTFSKIIAMSKKLFIIQILRVFFWEFVKTEKTFIN